ncbi:uracil-xanthine permease family protein [Lutispora saccharofermentans]|uniref:NCS2 family nucleobase:cation symporter n=1 Tax=Lutispora saccharofermentans TaxID=3024236 RepID=A0ABT1NCS1_9FIRM|nr:solute carrier family 23 protein [Lutispora saccharofermentans]MCQ1529065.1 NCS2 family nucleobase:cation symporter [Lutispora saccharofermentans]
MATSPNTNKDTAIRRGDLPLYKLIILGLQHTFTMFGATVLVPILTGLNISVALFTAGIGTWFFHFVTKMKVPVFLGSSFAYIAPIILVAQNYGGIEYATGGIVIAGLMYLLLAVAVYFVGPKLIYSFFPPIVTGPIIMVIGLNLAPTAVNMAKDNWLLAGICLATVIAVSLFAKGFLKVLPVLCGLIVGYIAAIAMGLVDFTPVAQAAWFGLPPFVLPKFSGAAISIVAPVAIASMVEHIGDVLAVSATVGDDFVSDPGLHRTLLGDGVATSLAAMLGGPANTTYSENTGVLALTKVFDPWVMRIAACFAIVLSMIPKLGAVISTIPGPVIGGISIVLFGMIASIGVRTVVENKVDFSLNRNLMIGAVILVLGIGGAVFDFKIFQLAGMALGAIVGIILNKILPEDR